MELDSKTYWLTDRQSQCDFDFGWIELRELIGGSRVQELSVESQPAEWNGRQPGAQLVESWILYGRLWW
jgi:hypothetical protein